MSAPAPDLAERYGRRSRASRVLVVGTAAGLVLAGLAWLVWVTLFHARSEVTSELVGYDVRGEHATTATFTVVRRDTDVRASCLLQAFSEDHSVVGELTVAVDSGPATARVRSTLRTEREATSLELIGCTAAGQRARR